MTPNYLLQIHNLLELIKKEQTIYDTIFSELIRQVSGNIRHFTLDHFLYAISLCNVYTI